MTENEDNLIMKTFINKKIIIVSIFPSGNIILSLNDNSLIIYENNLKIIQTISNAHDEIVNYINIKDENNFVTCSYDLNIKTWIKNNIKNECKFYINQTIYYAHYYTINKLIYCHNGNIISCSKDCKVKIWEEKDNKLYQYKTIITHSYEIYSILLLEDKKILITFGFDGIKFHNLYNYECIYYNTNIKSKEYTILKRLDNDRIIICDDYFIKIFSLSKKEIIKEIENGFLINDICIIVNKGVFIVGGEYKDIKVYKIDNYEYIQIIKNIFKGNYIYGLFNIKNNLILIHNENSFGISKLNKILN